MSKKPTKPVETEPAKAPEAPAAPEASAPAADMAAAVTSAAEKAAEPAKEAAAEKAPEAPVAKPRLPRYRVTKRATISMYGQICTLDVGTIIDAQGYGLDGVQRIKNSGVELEEMA